MPTIHNPTSETGPTSTAVETLDEPTLASAPPSGSSAATPELAIDVPVRRRTLVFIRVALTSATFGLISCLLLGLIIAVNLHDEPPFEDADLRNRWAPPAANQNAGPGLAAAFAMIPSNYFWVTNTWEGVPIGRALSEAKFGGFARGTVALPGSNAAWEADPVAGTVHEVLEQFAPMLEVLDAACSLPHCFMPTDVDPDEWFSKVDEAWHLLHLRAAAAFAEGDLEATAIADLAILRFTAHWIHGTSRLDQRTTVLAQLPLQLAPLRAHLEAGAYDGRTAEFIAAFRSLDLDRSDASEAIRMEYRRFRAQVLGAPEWLGDQDLSSRGMAYLFHPQETLRTIGDYYRAAIDEGERTGRVIESEPPTIHTGWAAKIWHGNGLGHGLLELAPLEVDSVYARSDEAAAAIARWIELLEAR